jgi:hypothetical protein
MIKNNLINNQHHNDANVPNAIDSEYNEQHQLILLTEANTKIINNIKLSLAIFKKLNNFTHNNIETILKNEILQSSKQ